MRNTIVTILLLLQLLLSPLSAQRNYPVYVTPTLLPPYSLKLSDYSSFGAQKLMLTITVNDLSITNLPVLLRLKMETAGVTIETPVTLATTPIYLNGGETSVLFGEDLSDYFNIDYLTFKGYSKQTYQRTGQLPEGFYKFTVEVLHHATRRVISNAGSTTAWIALGKPPVLRAPDDGARLGQYAGMPLTFSWLPSNVGSPMSAGNIRYQFEMWEMRVPGISPYTVAASMPVFHDNTSFSTSYSLYPATLMMEPGMTYAWRVTASDAGGFVPFEQDGHSQVRTFTYKALCDTVTGFTATAKGQSGLFCWEPGAGHTSYQIEMRQPETGWFNASETFDSKAEFFDLTPGTTYQMRVKSTCNSDPTSVSDFTAWRSLTVPVPKPLVDTLGCPTCGCDDNLPGVELTNFTLRDNLAPGDTIANKTGTTRFILKSVESQGAGTYKGIFLYWAEIWGVKFVCQYTDLQVNTDNVIVNMDFESVYDPQFLLDVDAAIDYFNALAGNLAVLTTSTAIKDTLQVTQSFDAIYVNGGDSLVAVSVDANGNITETVLAASSDNLGKTLVKGPDGEEYVVTNDGRVMGVKEYKATGGNSRLMKDHNSDKEQKVTSPSVSFSASTGQKYGFDAFTPIKQAIQTHYPQLPPSGGAPVPFKSVASFATDRVGVSATNGITFKDEMGIPALASGNDLTIRGSANGSTIGLYAYRAVNDSTEEVVGKLNIMSFDEQPKRLIVVPVNGYKLSDSYLLELQNTLNTIYAQAVTRWSVSAGNPITVNFPDGVMTHGGSSALAAYNADQKLIINTYDASQPSGLDKDALYLFFIDNVNGKAGVAGFMPLQRQCGFIYGNPNLNIVAHELGHGAFNLYHTFSSENYIAKEQSTDNLMDYKGGTELWKYQWENVQDPQRVWMSWAQGEQEGEATVDALYELDPIVPTQDVTQVIYCGMTPSGKIIESYPLKVQGKNVTSVISKNQLYFIVGFYVEDSETGVREYYKYVAPDKFLNKDNVAFPGEITYFNGTNCNVWVYQSMNSDCIYKCKAIAWEVPAKPLEASGLKSRIESSTLVKGWELVIRSEAQTHCLRDFFDTQSNSPECGNLAQIEHDQEVLNQLVSSIVGKSGDEALAARAALTICGVCPVSIKSIAQQSVFEFFRFLCSTPKIPELQEFALIKLMSAISPDHFRDVYTLLEADNNKVLKHLVEELHDVSIDIFNDEKNYTSFIKGLLQMYKEKPDLLVTRFGDLDYETSNELFNQVLNLEKHQLDGTFVMDKDHAEWMLLVHRGKYDAATGTVNIYEDRIRNILSHPNESESVTYRTETTSTLIAENLSPLTPVVVFTESTNDLVRIALDSSTESLTGTKEYVVPAIFLHYYDQKLFNTAVEKGAIVALDLLTIYSGVGVVSLGSKILQARRVIALIEVAGAMGDIAIQTIDFPPGSEFELGVNSFNMAMGMVGIKNAAVALKNFAVKLPETTRRLLRNNESLRAALLAELRKIKDLDASELTPQQKLAWEKVQAAKKKMLNLLESGEEAAKAGSYFGNLPRYQQLFKEGKLSELFAELKNTTAYPRMGYTRNRTYDFLYDEYKIANPNFENCPYLKNSIGTDFELDEVGYFVRLYSGDGKASKWIFRIEDLKKYDNIDDLIEDLAIPFDNGTIFGTKPSKIAIVEIPKGTTLRKSFAGEQVWKRTHDGLSDLIQKGGGVQYEILDVNFKNPPPSVKAWFGEVGEFDELIK